MPFRIFSSSIRFLFTIDSWKSHICTWAVQQVCEHQDLARKGGQATSRKSALPFLPWEKRFESVHASVQRASNKISVSRWSAAVFAFTINLLLQTKRKTHLHGTIHYLLTARPWWEAACFQQTIAACSDQDSQNDRHSDIHKMLTEFVFVMAGSQGPDWKLLLLLLIDSQWLAGTDPELLMRSQSRTGKFV